MNALRKKTDYLLVDAPPLDDTANTSPLDNTAENEKNWTPIDNNNTTVKNEQEILNENVMNETYIHEGY